MGVSVSLGVASVDTMFSPSRPGPCGPAPRACSLALPNKVTGSLNFPKVVSLLRTCTGFSLVTENKC